MKKIIENPEAIKKLIEKGFNVIGNEVEIEEDEAYKVDEIIVSCSPKIEVNTPAEKIENKKTEKKTSLKSSDSKKKNKKKNK